MAEDSSTPVPRAEEGFPISLRKVSGNCCKTINGKRLNKSTIALWLAFTVSVVHVESGAAATVGFSPTTGENRFINLLNQPAHTGYLNSAMENYVRATQTSDDEYLLKFYMAAGDPAAPTIDGGILSENSWVFMEFEVVTESGDAIVHRTFDPYKSIIEAEHYLLGRHVLRPGQHVFTIAFSDESCNLETKGCRNEATLEYKMTMRAIDTPIPGDANLDGKVGFDDFLTLSANFRGALVYLDPWHSGDFNQSATTTIADFQILSANYGMTREPAPNAVPEPNSSFMMWFAALLVLMIRKRRPVS